MSAGDTRCDDVQREAVAEAFAAHEDHQEPYCVQAYEEKFDSSRLIVGKFTEPVGGMDVTALRKLLTDDGVLGVAAQKRARPIVATEVGAVVSVRRKK